MKTLLRIDASTRRNGSHSRMIADYYQHKWNEKHPNGNIVLRDLANEPVPHLTDDMVEAFQEAGDQPSAATRLSDTLIQELKSADQLLISSPLYNLTLPSTLKAYFDHVVRSDHTFSVQGDQCIGLLPDKGTTVITTRGGVASPGVVDDFQTDYLKEILAYTGIDSVEVVALEGTSLDEAERSRRLTVAKQQVDQLFRNSEEPVWTGTFSLDERKEINALRDGQAMAIVNGDAAAYAKLCTRDVQLMIPGRDIISGQDQFLPAEEHLFRSASFAAFRKYPERIERSGDMIVEIGRQEVTMQKHSTEGGVFATHQKYMHVFRLTPDGWRYAVLMSNSCE